MHSTKKNLPSQPDVEDIVELPGDCSESIGLLLYLQIDHRLT